LALPRRRMRGSRAALSVIPVVHPGSELAVCPEYFVPHTSNPCAADKTPMERQWRQFRVGCLGLVQRGKRTKNAALSRSRRKERERKGNEKNRRGQGELSLDSQRVAIRLVIPVEASTLPCLIEPIGAGDHHGGGGSEGPGRSFEARRRALITLTPQICGGGLLGGPLRPQASPDMTVILPTW
jgi:hypothetical protein